MDFKFNSTRVGRVNYILKSEDINGNVGFTFDDVYYVSKNITYDTSPPEVNISANAYNATTGTDIRISYEIWDEYIDSVSVYKEEPDIGMFFVASFDCGSEREHCSGEFVYNNVVPGDITYTINVSDLNNNYADKSVTVHYYGESRKESDDKSGPNITLNVVVVEEGLANYTQLEYSSSDDSQVTYMNLYEKTGQGYDLLRTKFCFSSDECSAAYRRERLDKETTFLIVASDSLGNRARYEETYVPYPG